jgi:tyrosine-protein phosphatase YwqE
VFNLFPKKGIPAAQQRIELTADLHSHLIPSIDDGAVNDDQAINLVRGLQELGFKKCITTPHIYRGVHNNSKEKILSGLSGLNNLLEHHHIKMEIEAAAEYFFDEQFFELIEKNDLMTFAKNQVLFELPFNSKPIMLADIIFKLNIAGYQPVLAHPERYTFFHNRKLEEYHKLKNAGVYFQLNLMSLVGYYGKEVELTAIELLKNNMVEYAGSDLHKEKHLPVIDAALHNGKLAEYFKAGKLLNHLL